MDKVNLQYFSILKSLVWLSENLSSFNPNNDNFDNKKVDGGVWKGRCIMMRLRKDVQGIWNAAVAPIP